MAVETFDGEKALYDRDYSTGRRHVGNITVTDRRLIASVDNKRIASKTEIKISSVAGTIVGFKRSGVVAFIFGVIFALIDVALCIFINTEPSFNSKPGNWSNFKYLINLLTLPIEPNQKMTAIVFFAQLTVYSALALILIIVGVLKIRNGFYVGIYTDCDKTELLWASARLGKVRPLRLKTKKEVALQIQKELSNAILSAKYSV